MQGIVGAAVQMRPDVGTSSGASASIVLERANDFMLGTCLVKMLADVFSADIIAAMIFAFNRNLGTSIQMLLSTSNWKGFAAEVADPWLEFALRHMLLLFLPSKLGFAIRVGATYNLFRTFDS